jgi:D-sedoheptulose 7-phosphate isomerase
MGKRSPWSVEGDNLPGGGKGSCDENLPEMSKDLICASLGEGIALRQAMLEHTGTIAAGGELWLDTLRAGRTILLAGNGGSAADAQHLAAEMVGRFERLNGFPALALTVDTSSLTALGNDFGFEHVYSQQLLALGRPGDLLVAISTSGNSPNILAAAETARQLGMKVLGMTGRSGGRLEPLCQVCLKVPSERTCRIQEVHLSVGHIWCEMVEAVLPVPQRQGTPACG